MNEVDAHGSVLIIERHMTAERIRWYGDGFTTAKSDSGQLLSVPPGIHTVAELAGAVGFQRPVADGMIVTNWIGSLLTETFGVSKMRSGKLKVKYISPMYEGSILRLEISVSSRDESVVERSSGSNSSYSNGVTFTIKAFADGVLCTVGEGRIGLDEGGSDGAS